MTFYFYFNNNNFFFELLRAQFFMDIFSVHKIFEIKCSISGWYEP